MSTAPKPDAEIGGENSAVVVERNTTDFKSKDDGHVHQCNFWWQLEKSYLYIPFGLYQFDNLIHIIYERNMEEPGAATPSILTVRKAQKSSEGKASITYVLFIAINLQSTVSRERHAGDQIFGVKTKIWVFLEKIDPSCSSKVGSSGTSHTKLGFI